MRCGIRAHRQGTKTGPSKTTLETKQTENKQTDRSSFFRKMRHEVTLKSEILSQLDFNSAAQDVVFNCVDGQVWYQITRLTNHRGGVSERGFGWNVCMHNAGGFGFGLNVCVMQVEANSILLAIISPFLQLLLKVTTCVQYCEYELFVFVNGWSNLLNGYVNLEQLLQEQESESSGSD